MRRLLPALALIFLLSACATVRNPVTGARELTVMDERTEIAEGKKNHEQVIKEYGVYDNPALQAYVTELGQKLAAQSHRSNLEWHFTVLDSTEINAFALPGGYVYITRGIMAHLESEADLAGVLGHEIGHVTARHGAQRATRQQVAGIGVLAANVLGVILEAKGYGGVGNIATNVTQGVAAGYIASYSREQETQADGLGAEYLARTNYNPRSMISVIRVLKEQERYAEDKARAEKKPPPAQPGWLASHPSNDKRLMDITNVAATYLDDYGDAGRARYLKAITGLSFGEGREQGVTRGQNFYHEPLGIALTAPDGWKIKNTPDAIVMNNAANDAGLVVKLAPPDAGATHDQVVRNLFRLERGQAEQVADRPLPTTHVSGFNRNKQGQQQRIEATLITGPENRTFLLVYAAKGAQELQRARDDILKAETSFRALSAKEKLAARPWAIKTAILPPGGFAQLARTSPLPDAERQLRLLNGVYTGGEIKPGQVVKVVE